MDGSGPLPNSIVQRKGPDFGLDGDIPRWWFGNDPFKTRFFDAMSLLFPEGERFFIECVRDYRDQISDPVLLGQVKDFTFQEGQHGMVHTAYNARSRASLSIILLRRKSGFWPDFENTCQRVTCWPTPRLSST